jgi:hypothetical protein
MGEFDAGLPAYIVAAVVAGLLVCMALLTASARYGARAEQGSAAE